MAATRKPCWRCGAIPRCPKCGSTELRRTRNQCAACHRRHTRERDARKRAEAGDFEVTPAMRRYLAAFDRYLMAWKAGDSRAMRKATAERQVTLAALEGRD